jgi:hypothetical protein
MVIVKGGKNWVRSLMVGGTTGTINYAGLGTVDTSPSESDTGLNNNTNFGVSDTIRSVTNSVSDKQIVFDYNLPSTAGTGVTFKEFGLNIGTTTLFNRQTFYGMTHNNTEEWQISIAVSIK